MLTCWLFMGALLLGQAPADAGANDDNQLSLQIRRLVRQLDDDQLSKRVEAERSLIELGPQALDLLPPATTRTTAEVKERLARVRKALETAAAEAATKSSRVTLRGEMALVDALTLMQQQTGNRVVGAENRNENVKTDFQNTPYWQALDSVLDQVGLTINQYGGQPNSLVVVARPDEQRPRADGAVYSGVFRFEAARLDAVRDLRNPQVSGLRLSLEISWEPRTAPISLSQPLDQIVATDENGDPLLVDGRRGRLDVPVQSGVSAVDLSLSFQLPDRNIRKIASLRGTLTAMIPGRVESFEFPDIDKAKDVQQHRAGVTVVLEQLRKNVDLYELRMHVRFDEAANALESHRGWIYNNEAYLLDPQGQRIEQLGIEATRQEVDAVGIAFLFDLADGPAGHRFVYKTPAAIVKVPVEYELTNIELP